MTSNELINYSCQAVVTDLDGTVIDRQATVSDSVVAAAANLQRAGVPLIAASARTPAGVTALERLVPYVEIAVCCNGALGWSPAQQSVLWHRSLDLEIIRRIINVLDEQIDNLEVASFDGNHWRMTENYAVLRGSNLPGSSEVLPVSAIGSASACRLVIRSPGLQASQIAAELYADGVQVTEATLTWAKSEVLDISPPGVDKASGVHQALDLLGIDWANTIAFGDMPNDLPMLRSAGLAIAVANAHEEVIAAADLVTTSVENDGFAHALQLLGVV
jgi:Cof subfamily protein (haloacid dehalogenase superfamily)